MKILAISDLHDEEIVLGKLKAYYSKEKFDYVFIAGDTSNRSLSFIEDTIESFSNVFFIQGNNEPKEIVEELYRKKGFVHSRRVEIEDGLNVAGFGYSTPTPFGTPGELSEAAFYAAMGKLNIDRNTLLLCHSPPKGMFDFVRGTHIGSESIKKIIEEKKPFATFCGHAHELDGVMKHGETTIVKIPAATRNKAMAVTVKDKTIDARVVDI
jgi:hypothetical protein